MQFDGYIMIGNIKHHFHFIMKEEFNGSRFTYFHEKTRHYHQFTSMKKMIKFILEAN